MAELKQEYEELEKKSEGGEVMQISVEVSHDVWQKFCLLCTGKDPTTVLTEMVENAWRATHPEIKELRGEQPTEAQKTGR